MTRGHRGVCGPGNLCGGGLSSIPSIRLRAMRAWGLSVVLVFVLVMPGQILYAGGLPGIAVGGIQAGPDDFRISSMGPNGSTAYGAFWFFLPNMAPDVAYNSASNQYLVVWYGDDNTSPLVDNEYEIFGQLVDSTTGALVGSRFRISFMGPNGNVDYGALLPSVTYNSTENEYLVVWVGDHSVLPLVNDHFEVFGRRVAANGTLLGSQTRISEMGPFADPAYGAAWWIGPDVAYNATDNIYLVVWTGDTNVAPQVDDEFEIWGRRLFADLTTVDSFADRISYMGPDGNTAFYASQPAVAWDSTTDNFLVVWEGDTNTAGLIDDEVEIFGQFIVGDPAIQIFLAANFQISAMGGVNGNATFDGYDPDVAYNAANQNYLVVWAGDDNQWGTADEEFEIWGQLVAPNGSMVTSSYRISVMGQFDGNAAYDAGSPAVISVDDLYHIVWHGDGDQFGQVDDEFEIFTGSVPADPLQVGLLINERLTTMGVGGDTSRGAFDPALSRDPERGGALLVWWGDDNIDPSVDDEFEVFGQLLSLSPLFTDGFESGNTTGWSSSSP